MNILKRVGKGFLLLLQAEIMFYVAVLAITGLVYLISSLL
jgi:hypothetical protein